MTLTFSFLCSFLPSLLTPRSPGTFLGVMLWPLLLPLPWAGSLAQNSEYQLKAPSSVEVEEGLCVLVSCSVHFPSFPSPTDSVFGYWFQNGANINSDSPVATNNPNRQVKEATLGRFQLTGDPQNSNCSLLIKDARQGDTGAYFFRVERGSMKYSYSKKPLAVKVLALTKTPDIQVPGNLSAGYRSNLTCSVPWACEQGKPPLFSWMSADLTHMASRNTYFSELTFTPRPQDHGTNLTCRVTFPGAGVTVEKTVQLDVLYAPEKLTIKVYRGQHTEPEVLHSNSSLQVQEGESLLLDCVADSNPQAKVSWEKPELKSNQSSTHQVLQLPQVTLEDQGKYICRALYVLSAVEISVSLIMRNPLELLGPSCSWEAEGLLCSCSSRAQPAPSLRWRLGAGLLEGNSSNASFKVTSISMGPLANSTLKLHGRLNSSLRLSCEALNDHEAQRAIILLLLHQDVVKGKPGTETGMVQGAILGAGITALLAVCPFLIVVIVRTYRTKSAEKAASREETCPAKSIVSRMLPPSVYVRRCSRGDLNASRLPSPENHSSLDTATTTATDTPGQEPELHYASLSFQGLKPRQPLDPEHAQCEYSEIKIHKL
uniref:sialic acid-binding Ig-like lectin 5 n=1 Tax=Jaculus jaculus TaxID=51337 RepID=UPI001E1B3BA9|nr:sialic acid-binding Ig-like lectin 5 [Jaculus jaculus]